VSERGRAVCVLNVRVIGFSMRVLKLCAFVVGSCIRVISGGV